MKRGPRRPFLWILLGVVAILGLSILGAYLIFVAPVLAKRDRLAERTVEAMDDFHAQRWERPVLRGEPIEGNAHAAQLEAIAPFVEGYPSESGERVTEELDAGTIGPETIAEISRWWETLEAYRDSARRTWSWGDMQVELGMGAPEMELASHMHLLRLLLADATRREPAECLALGTDAIRISQDRAAGTGLIGLMIHHAMVRRAFDVISDCVARADARALRAIEPELVILVEHPAPTGHALEAEALFMSAELSSMTGRLDRVPTDGRELEDWLQAMHAVEAWELLLGDPAARRSYGEHYPGDVTRFETWAASVEAHGNPLVDIGGPSMMVRYLHRDAATRSAIRLLLALVRVRLEIDGELPADRPDALDDPALHDPRTGQPFDWVVAGDHAELRSEDPFRGGDEAIRLSAELTARAESGAPAEEDPPSAGQDAGADPR